MTTKASGIAAFLASPLNGKDIVVNARASLQSASIGCLIFANVYSDATRLALKGLEGVCALVVEEFRGKLSCAYIIVDNPRLAFAKVATQFFVPSTTPRIASTAIIGNNVTMGARISIGEFTVISDNTVIGDDTVIRNHVVISAGTQIGGRCLIKSHAILGEEGFGFESDTASVPVRIPHFGRVLIGNDVEIGAGTVIARGTLDDTVIGENTKIDDLVFIAHNVQIGPGSMIVAQATIVGSVTIGRECWVGPNASIRDGVTLGDNALIGIGAVVTKLVSNNVTVAGNPARVFERKPT